MLEFAWELLKSIFLPIGILFLLCVLFYFSIIQFIAAYRSKYLISIDEKLDRLIELLEDGKELSSDEDTAETEKD